jgi:hypothetical protein
MGMIVRACHRAAFQEIVPRTVQKTVIANQTR